MQRIQPVQAKASVDDIVIGSKSLEWLSTNGIMPSQWKLSQEEESRIMSAGIALKITFSPFFVYDLSGHKPERGRIIFFSSAFVEKKVISREETVAFCLHEIGHSVNKWKSMNQIGSPELHVDNMKRKEIRFADEFDADDYARHCGFGSHLADGLQKLIDLKEPGFDAPVNHERIKRIRENTIIQRHFKT